MRLFFIKLIHTLVWAFIASCVLFVLVAGISGAINRYVYISIGVVFLEMAILLIFKWRCPLTIVAETYTQDRRANFDIFIPEFLARHNKSIFSVIFVIGLILIMLRSVYQK